MIRLSSLKKNEGFTVIELILAIAIAGIIMGAVGSYLVFNLSSFNDTKDIIDIQYEGQLAINQVTDIARESKGIVDIKDESGTSVMNSSTPVINPSEITFKHYELVGAGASTVTEITTYNIRYTQSNGTMTCYITYPDGTTDNYVMAKKISGFTVEPTNMGTGNSIDYEYAKSMQMYFTMADGGATMSMQSQVKFRNYNK